MSDTTMTLTVAGQTVGTFTTTYQMTAAEGARVIAAYGKIMGQRPDDPALPWTPAEIVDFIARGFLAGVLANTLRQEQQDAAEQAAAAVPPIVPTPVP